MGQEVDRWVWGEVQVYSRDPTPPQRDQPAEGVGHLARTHPRMSRTCHGTSGPPGPEALMEVAGEKSGWASPSLEQDPDKWKTMW